MQFQDANNNNTHEANNEASTSNEALSQKIQQQNYTKKLVGKRRQQNNLIKLSAKSADPQLCYVGENNLNNNAKKSDTKRKTFANNNNNNNLKSNWLNSLHFFPFFTKNESQNDDSPNTKASNFSTTTTSTVSLNNHHHLMKRKETITTGISEPVQTTTIHLNETQIPTTSRNILPPLSTVVMQIAKDLKKKFLAQKANSFNKINQQQQRTRATTNITSTSSNNIETIENRRRSNINMDNNIAEQNSPFGVELYHRNTVLANDIKSTNDNDKFANEVIKKYAIHTIIEYTNMLVPDMVNITNAPYYWGCINRYEAEKLLENKPEGTFILRDSAQINYLFSISFRRYERTLHARIEHLNGKFSFDINDKSVFSSHSITKLINNYKDPTRCLFFEPQLSIPLPRNFAFTLQNLCRSVIASNCSYETVSELPIPINFKKFVREYHYKQPIRITEYES